MNEIRHNGVSYPSIAALAREYGLAAHTISSRIRQGHTIQHALSSGRLGGRTLAKINTRAEWMVSLGWSVEGLCTSGKWGQWGEVLTLLYRDHSIIAIAGIFGVAPRVIQMDLKEFGIETRGKGGANHRTIEHHRRVERVAINEVRELRVERRRGMSEQNRGGVCGLEA